MQVVKDLMENWLTLLQLQTKGLCVTFKILLLYKLYVVQKFEASLSSKVHILLCVD